MLKYLKFLRALSKEDNFISVVYALTSAALNFLFLIIATRILTVKEFGVFAGTWAVISLAGIATAGLQNFAMAQASTNLSNIKYVGAERKSLMTVALKYSVLISALFFLFLTTYSNSSLEIVMRNGLLAFSFPIYTLTSIVLGQTLGAGNPKKFYKIGLFLSIFKICFSAIYLSISKNINGLIFLLLIFQAVFFIFIYRKADHDTTRISAKNHNLRSIPIMSVTTLFYVLAVLDVPLFRLHSDSFDSGQYAGISTITKIPLMILGIVNTLILSKTSSIVELNRLKMFERKIGFKYFLFVGFVILFFIIFQDLLTFVFLGEKYKDNNFFVGQLLAYTGLITLGFCISLYFKHFTTQDLLRVFSLFLIQLAVMFYAEVNWNGFFALFWVFPILMSVILHPGLRLRKTPKKI